MNAAALLGPALALCASVACALCDVRTGTIPNRITYPAFAAIVLLAASHGAAGTALAGAAAAGGSLFLLHAGTRGRGLGLGDVKLGACIGGGLGVMPGLVALGCAFVAGACVGLTLLALRRARRGDALPFGPYLAFGALCATVGAVAR